MALSSCSTLSSKPSKQDVKDGFYKVAKEQDSSLSDKQIKTLTDCVVDDIYDELSESGATALAENDKSEEGTDKDGELIVNASKKCALEIIK